MFGRRTLFGERREEHGTRTMALADGAQLSAMLNNTAVSGTPTAGVTEAAGTGGYIDQWADGERPRTGAWGTKDGQRPVGHTATTVIVDAVLTAINSNNLLALANATAARVRQMVNTITRGTVRRSMDRKC